MTRTRTPQPSQPSQPWEVLHRWTPGQRRFAAPSGTPRNPATPDGTHMQTRAVGFVKGPIPLPWLQAAASLPGKTLHVGLCLWYLAGLTRSMKVRLSTKAAKDMGVSRDAKSDALRRLVEAGLVTVEQHSGKAPVVTLVATSS